MDKQQDSTAGAPQAPVITLAPTPRGFLRGEFEDQCWQCCSIQELRLDDEALLRLGVDETETAESARMYLTQAQVAALLPLLERFVARGDLRESEGAEVPWELAAEKHAAHEANIAALEREVEDWKRSDARWREVAEGRGQALSVAEAQAAREHAKAERLRDKLGLASGRIAYLTKRVEALEQALAWCGSADDFAPAEYAGTTGMALSRPEGKAREGWLKICKPLLDSIGQPTLYAALSLTVADIEQLDFECHRLCPTGPKPHGLSTELEVKAFVYGVEAVINVLRDRLARVTAPAAGKE